MDDDDHAQHSLYMDTQEPPVGRDQTIEIYAFMEAADESKKQDGKAVKLSDIIDRAKEKSAADLKAAGAK